MKKTFRLDGLDCANCAAKMETAIGRLSGVDSVSINFLTTKMVIEAAEEKMSGVVDAAAAIIKKLEPQVEIRKG